MYRQTRPMNRLVISVTALNLDARFTGMMPDLPSLDVWVTDGCRSCARTLRVIHGCGPLQDLVDIRVCKFGTPGLAPPKAVIGGPAVVFLGVVIALGTPECSALVERILELTRATAAGGGS